MKFVQTRYIIMFGFAFTGAAMFYSSFLAPDVDFRTLVWMRTLQTAPLAFLFVPISTIAYLTLPDRYRSDGSACSPCSATCSAPSGSPSRPPR